MNDFQRLLQGRQFSSIEEVNTFLAEHMGKINRQSVADFHGLSPEQMHRFLHFPFSSPGLIDFKAEVDVTSSIPILSLFSILIDGIGEKGLKATATGNLPRKFCQEAAALYQGDEEFHQLMRFVSIRTEQDFFELHVAKALGEQAGLIGKERGRYILSNKCRRTIAKSGLSGIYPLLLQNYAAKFNWAYRDRYPAIPFIQQAFLFSLYLLSLYGETWLPFKFYEDAFLTAFPKILSEVGETTYSTPENQFRRCYSLRTFSRFAAFFGLAEVETVDRDRFEYRCRGQALLSQVVRFNTAR